MGNTDSVPVVSQLKSLTQYVGGDSAGALATQENFAYRNTFPIVSQIASAGYAIGGDMDKARDLQEKFAEDMQKVIDSIPVAGHIKGGVHFALGQNEQGEDSMKAASRSTGVVLGGVGGFVVGGPVGAVAGGIAGGAAADGIITGSEVLAHGPTARPYGVVAIGGEIVKAVEGKRNITVSEGFDMAMVPVSDGLGGFGAGKMIGKPLGLGKPGVSGGSKIPYLPLRGAVMKTGERSSAAAAAGGIGAEGALSKVKVAGVNIVDDVGVDGALKVKPAAAGVTLADDAVNPPRIGLNKAALDNRANQLNPNHELSGPGRPAGYKGIGTKPDLDNHANQLNPNHPLFQQNRVVPDIPGQLVDVV